ncbi:hexadecenal dehydrogenase [Sporobolomyces salmoneus]|uniref:hexadecenal dehydrogenase n=1 Tax=Sporobolomyces salmoneus TaxID=183962 RepID=UPI003176C53E
MDFTPTEQIQPAYDAVYETFLSGVTRPVSWRKHQIKQLGFLIQDNEDAFVKALETDFGRPAFETIVAELNPVKAEINEVYDHVEKWATPTKVSTVFMWKAAKPTVYYEPKGVALIIGTWNYPITLLLVPLLGAIAAGCTAIVKPAEQAPATAALIARLIPQYLDTSAYRCVTGAIDQTSTLLKLQFDHIFYTGSGNVGRIVSKAAAEHLTPVTLELGGKSPAIVLDDADLDVSARRIIWAKFSNAGQICISTDYILCSPELEPKLIEALKRALKEFSAPSPSSGTQSTSLIESKNYSKIINDNHFRRLSKLLDATKGDIIVGGKRDEKERKIEVTLVRNVKPDDALMADEIFGPILPIMTMPNKDAMIHFIQRRDTPLVIYVFTQSTKNKDYIFERTRSGGFVQNDVLVHFLIPGLPFGGTGKAGHGNYHGKKSFDTFSHERAFAHVPTWMDAVMASRYPPYTDKKFKFLMLASKAVIKRPAKYGLSTLLKLFAVLTTVLAIFRGRSKL